MAEVAINIQVREDGSVEVQKLGGEFKKTGEEAEKSAEKTTGAWGKVKVAMKGVVGVVGAVSSKILTLGGAAATIAGVGLAAKQVGRGFREAGDTAQETAKKTTSAWDMVKSTMKGVSGSINNFIKRIFSLQGAIATLAGAGGIGYWVKSFISASSQMEDFQTRFVSLTKSTELAREKLKALSDYAAKTPFKLQGIIEAGVTLEAFGLAAEAGIKPLGDLAAFMGIKIVDASRALGRAFAAGAGAADVLRERGVLALVKLRMGIQDLSKLTLPEFRKALLDTLTDPGGKIFGATARLAKTFTGAMSMMSDAVFQLHVTLGDALKPAIKSLVNEQIIPLVKSIKEWALQNKELINQKFESFVMNLYSVVKFLGESVIWLVDVVGGWIVENKDLLITLGELYIAFQIATVAIGFFIKALVVGKIISFVSSLGILQAALGSVVAFLTGGGGLTAALFLLKPVLISIGIALGLLLTYKVGKWAHDWAFGVKEASLATEAAKTTTEAATIATSQYGQATATAAEAVKELTKEEKERLRLTEQISMEIVRLSEGEAAFRLLQIQNFADKAAELEVDRLKIVELTTLQITALEESMAAKRLSIAQKINNDLIKLTTGEDLIPLLQRQTDLKILEFERFADKAKEAGVDIVEIDKWRVAKQKELEEDRLEAIKKISDKIIDLSKRETVARVQDFQILGNSWEMFLDKADVPIMIKTDVDEAMRNVDLLGNKIENLRAKVESTPIVQGFTFGSTGKPEFGEEGYVRPGAFGPDDPTIYSLQSPTQIPVARSRLSPSIGGGIQNNASYDQSDRRNITVNNYGNVSQSQQRETEYEMTRFFNRMSKSSAGLSH